MKVMQHKGNIKLQHIDQSRVVWPIIDFSDPTKLNYLGACFFVGSPPTLVTCRHILEGISDARVQSPNYTNIPIKNVKFHSSLDLAIANIDSNEMEVLQPLSCPLTLGGELSANSYFKDILDGNPVILPHLSKGYIASTPVNSYSNPGFGLYHLSFPSLAGYSGAPVCIFNTRHFAGILIGNKETSVTVFSHSEVDDDGKKWAEKTVRIIDEGLFIGYADIMKFIQET
ncbi:MAG: trypsin-like peptidase domain-containing protein [Acetobacter sp.]|nr:trypsin-like peptidase domain-containing protein [Acetobacter sp.]